MNNQSKKIYFLIGIVFLACLVSLLVLSTIISIFQKRSYEEKAETRGQSGTIELSGAILDSDAISLLANEIQTADSSQFLGCHLEIINFDVSEAGHILIAYTNNRIAVYDENFCFLTGFTVSGKIGYYVQWNHDNIQIVFVRGSSCLEIAPQGDIVRGFRIDSHNGSLFADLGKRDRISTSDGTVFRAEKGTNPLSVLSGNHYLRLIKIAPNGNETVLYDVTLANILKTLFLIICIAFLFFLALAGAYYHHCEKNKRTTESSIST